MLDLPACFLHACQFTVIKAECLSVEKMFYQGILDKECFTKRFLAKSVLPRDSRQRMFYQGILEKECFTKGFSTKSVLPRDSGMQLGGGCQIVCWRAPPCTAGRGCALTKPSCVLLSKHTSVLSIQCTHTCHLTYICYICM